MKSLLITIFSLLFITSTLANVLCTNNDQSSARKFYLKTKEKFESGSLKKFDVLIAKATLLDVKQCAGSLSLPLYCIQKNAVLKKVLNILNLLHERSMADTSNVAWGFDQIIKLRKSCNL